MGGGNSRTGGWECRLRWVPFSRCVAWWMLCVPLAISGRCPWSCLSRATVGFGLPPHPYSAAPSGLSASLHGSVLVCGMVSGAGGLRTVWLPAHRQGEGRGRSSLCASGPSAGGEGGRDAWPAQMALCGPFTGCP